jgi:hypothetical protein
VDTPVVVAIIVAGTGLFASALTFFLTKSKEREGEWRRVRIEQYKELISAMSEAAGSNPSDAAKRRLALASNHIGLFASPAVLRHLTSLLDAVKSGQLERHDEMLTALMHAIRVDLGVPGSHLQGDIKFKLWAPGGGR